MFIAICDDSKVDAEKIRFSLMDITDDLEMKYFPTGVELIDSVKKGNAYSIIFQDIFLENENGMDIAKAVKDAKAGKVEFRADKQGMIHCPIGKIQFKEDDLIKNYATLADAILKAKPSSAKGTFVKSVYLSTTMGPGIKLDPKTFAAEVKELV